MADLNKKLNVKLSFSPNINRVVSILLIFWTGWITITAWQILKTYQSFNELGPFISAYNKFRLSSNHNQGDDSERVLLFGGDVMLARHVQLLQENCGSYICAWEDIAEKFKSADLAVVNLESPFSDQPPYPSEGFIFKARQENIEGLEVAGIDVVSLANNHFGNGGISGMRYTFEILANKNIVYVGAGENIEAAYQSRIIDAGGLKVGILAQSYPVAWYQATNEQPGIAGFSLPRLRKEIESIKNHQADLIVAVFHGGVEYVIKPNSQQTSFAHTAIDAGADLVVGHHPHWIQQIDEYKGKYIFYSLGNLIFDQDWSKKTSQGLILEVLIKDKKINGFNLLPVIIDDNFKPRWADETETEEILGEIPGVDLINGYLPD